ncbi:MAG: hypothetical protein CL893_01435 [Dehalococcoidia bacterium]|nr:hypothetical protein [Dehalococcoidia bacterium]MBC78511.1 hypothetical protein [Chloroflexota bacterium]|tara:strand:- start:1918 stop:2283 length:366 start_codon:yes stop_codon:yes gene_type:complete
MKNEKIVFYDHNCGICTCFSHWVQKRTNYWNFFPNDIDTVRSKKININEETLSSKIVCIDESNFYGAIAILKIYSKCGGLYGFLGKFLILLKPLYFLYSLGYFLFSKNRSKFSFLIKYIDC